jgi:hypothetical protein
MLHRNWLRHSISAALIVCVLGSTTTCMHYQARSITPDDRLPLQEKNIIILHQGELSFQLSGARFSDNQLTGVVADTPSLNKASKQYELHLYLSNAYRTSLAKGAEIVVPLEMISTAIVYDVNLQKTVINTSILTSILTLVGVSVGISLLSVLVMSANGGSCPYVYVDTDGKSRFVGDIYPGAVQPALERHDYLLLDPMSPRGDEYRLKLVNELKEVQHTNLAELVVCDHPPDTAVLMDKYGCVHTIQEPTAPIQGMDSNGNSILEVISRRDDRTANPRMVPVSDSGLYALYVTFPRLPQARSAKLLLRARNSLWLDYCYYRFQANFGSAFAGWQAKQKNATSDELLRWRREQGISLSVSMKSDREWKYIDCFNEVGPSAAREQVLVVDLGEQSSDDLQIKLESGFLFWEVDFLGIDYSEDLPVTRTTVSLLQAESQGSLDVTAALRADDGKYYDQHEIGNSAMLRFPCPPQAQDMSRTIYLHAKGYYEVIRDFSGEPNIAMLLGFREPGAFPRYSSELFSELCQ